MKRLFCILLILSLFLCGCSKDDEVVFYYLPSDYLSEAHSSLLVPESRTVTGYTENLPFLISLYLSGPTDPELASPFPVGTKLYYTTTELPNITVYLQELPENMTDAEYSLACACLSMTVMKLAGAETVTVVCGNQSVTIDPSMLILYDEPTPSATIPGGTQ